MTAYVINGSGGGGMVDPLTTEGDIIIADATGAPIRLPVGATGYFLRSAAGRPAWREYSAAGLIGDRPPAAAVREGMVYWATDAAAGSEGSQCVHQGGTTYAWVTLPYGTPSTIVQAGASSLIGLDPAGTAIISDGAGAVQMTSTDVSAMLAAADAAAARAAIGATGATFGHSWERPAPNSVLAGSTFINSDDLTEQVSSGLAVSPGVAATGWMRRLPTGLGDGRASLSGAPNRVYADSLPLSAYTIGSVTVACLFTWNGTQPSTYGISEVAMVGDFNNSLRGVHIGYLTNGANTDLAIASGAAWTVLIASVNLLAGASGLHALCVAPVNSGGHKWRFSYDGSAVADVAMGASYVAPNGSDSIALGARGDALIYLNGTSVEFAVWNSLLSNADILALATLPATPTYELPESASTGAAAICVQASRYDPRAAATTMPARGVSKSLTVAPDTNRTNL